MVFEIIVIVKEAEHQPQATEGLFSPHALKKIMFPRVKKLKKSRQMTYRHHVFIKHINIVPYRTTVHV